MVRTPLALLAAALLARSAAAQVLTPPGSAPGPGSGTLPPGPGASGTRADKPADAGAKPDWKTRGKVTGEIPPAAVLEEVSGTVGALDLEAHRLTVDTASGRVALGLDRNTLVYGPAGLVTVRELKPGVPVRAARNAQNMAYWVALRAPGKSSAEPGKSPEPGSTPGQGTGPGGGGGPPAEGGGTGSPGGPPTGVGPGNTAPGPSSPPSGAPGR
jgi:hypothetical protein